MGQQCGYSFRHVPVYFLVVPRMWAFSIDNLIIKLVTCSPFFIPFVVSKRRHEHHASHSLDAAINIYCNIRIFRGQHKTDATGAVLDVS